MVPWLKWWVFRCTERVLKFLRSNAQKKCSPMEMDAFGSLKRGVFSQAILQCGRLVTTFKEVGIMQNMRLQKTANTLFLSRIARTSVPVV